jgi:AcrR family transcriptional regulator
MNEDAAERVALAIQREELSAEDLSARKLCAFLGKTTGVLYHSFASLDGFLFTVSQRGMGQLGERLTSAYLRSKDLGDVAVAFVEFGLDHPVMYELMFERHFDWTALRKAGLIGQSLPGGQLWEAMHGLLAGAGSKDPETDGRLLWAGLHGLVSLAASGRANVRALDRTDREVACAAARALAAKIVGGERR